MKKVAHIVGFILIVILIGILLGLGILIYLNFFYNGEISILPISISHADFENPEETQRMSIGEFITDIFATGSKEPEIEYSPEESSGKFYYEQLNANQKLIYNGLQENKDNMKNGIYVIKFGDAFHQILEQEGGTQTLQADYQTAIEAYIHDNPDLFYLDISKLYLNIETTKKIWEIKYNVFIGPANDSTYFSNDFSDEYEVQTALSQIESIKDYIISQLGNDKYKNIKYIHDYLINNIEYDQTYNKKGTYTIYGALVGKSCVCDGYARAFKYLCNEAGINCELIQGTATNSAKATENHAWNGVELNNRWYGVDVTWDDPLISGVGIKLNSWHYKYFLKGNKTLQEDHKTNGQFTENGKIFEYPTLSNTDY